MRYDNEYIDGLFSSSVHIFKEVYIAPDKAVYCVFTQLLGPKNAIKLFSVRTKTQ